MKTASWIVLTIAGALTLLGSLASLSTAYFSGRDSLGGVELEELADGRAEVITAIRARRATAAAYAAGFAVLLLAITLGPYRRGDPWAWYAILAGTLTETLLTLMRVPFVGTRAGAGTALVQLVVVGIGLALGAGRLRPVPVVAVLLFVAAPARADAAIALAALPVPAIHAPALLEANGPMVTGPVLACAGGYNRYAVASTHSRVRADVELFRPSAAGRCP